MLRAPGSRRCLPAALALAVSTIVASTGQAAPPQLPPETTEAPRIADPPAPAPVSDPPAPSVVAPRIGSSCSTDDSLSLTGTNLWAGLSDKPLVLSLNGGEDLHGSVVAQSSDQLAVARTSDGVVVSVAKRDVAGIRASSAARIDGQQRGRGLADDGRKQSAGGAVLLTFGSIFALSGTVMLGICPGCVYIHLPLLLPGAGMIGGGVALVKAGKRKKAEYERSWGIASRARIAPSFALGRDGGYAGVVLRF